MKDRPENYDTIALSLKALDQLRCALDEAILNDNEDAAGLLIWAIRDLAETIDLINHIRKSEHDACGSCEDNPFSVE